MFFALHQFYLSLVLDVLGEKSFSSDLIDFFEVFVHNGKSSIMGIKVVGGVSNGN
jgi:hypothetical protein